MALPVISFDYKPCPEACVSKFSDCNGFQWISMDLGWKSGGGFKGVKAIKGQNGSPSDLFWLQTLSWGLCIEIQWLDCSDWIELIGLKWLDCNGPTRSTSGGSADVSRVGMLIHCSRLSHVHFSQRATDIIISRLLAGENNKNRWPHLSLTIGMIMMVINDGWGFRWGLASLGWCWSNYARCGVCSSGVTPILRHKPVLV